MDIDAGFVLNLSLDLRLPLVLQTRPGLADAFEQFLGAIGLAQQLPVQAMFGDAIPALGRDDDCTTWTDDLRGGAHAFDRLVEVQIQRVARIGSDHDVEWLADWDHSGLAHELAAGRVRQVDVTGKHAGNGFLTVEGDVEQEQWFEMPGHLADFLPNRVSAGDAPGCVGVGDHSDSCGFPGQLPAPPCRA